MILSANISQTTHHSIHNLPGHWRVGTHVKSSHVMEVASFPGSLRTRTKRRKEGESLVKFRLNNNNKTQKDSFYEGFILAVEGFWFMGTRPSPVPILLPSCN